MSKPKPPASCRHCRYYHITWDPNAPYGCHKLGFKSRLEPSQYVLQVSGKPCLNFTPKANSEKVAR